MRNGIFNYWIIFKSALLIYRLTLYINQLKSRPLWIMPQLTLTQPRNSHFVCDSSKCSQGVGDILKLSAFSSWICTLLKIWLPICCPHRKCNFDHRNFRKYHQMLNDISQKMVVSDFALETFCFQIFAKCTIYSNHYEQNNNLCKTRDILLIKNCLWLSGYVSDKHQTLTS